MTTEPTESAFDRCKSVEEVNPDIELSSLYKYTNEKELFKLAFDLGRFAQSLPASRKYEFTFCEIGNDAYGFVGLNWR